MSQKPIYKNDVLDYDVLKRLVQIPKFQRSVVWSEKQKKTFINDTIRWGHPFGSFLLYEYTGKESMENNDKKYLLIDGLQRLSTIIDCEKEIKDNNKKTKYTYLDIDTISKSYIEAMEYEIKNNTSIWETVHFTKIKELVRSYIREKKSTLDYSDSSDIIPENASKNDANIIIGSVNKALASTLEAIRDYVDLKNLKIPVTIVRDIDKNKLSEIFEKINTSGTVLSKYDTYAALWANKICKTKDEDILKAVEDRYIDLTTRADIEIENFNEGSIKDSGEINLFEYAYALGKVLKKAIPDLFNGDRNTEGKTGGEFAKKAKHSMVDSIGFYILILCAAGSVQGLDKLPDFFEDSFKITQENTNDEDIISKLKDILVSIAKDINKQLSKYIRSSDGTKKYNTYNKFQLCSMISVAFHARYKVIGAMKDIQEKEQYKYDYNRILENFISYYLYDAITGQWRNSGDTKSTAMAKQAEQNIRESRYYKRLTEENWQGALERWFVENNQEFSGSKASYDAKLFLNYLYIRTPRTIILGDEDKKQYDVEHIVPCNRLEKALKKDDQKKEKFIPMSSICNLCLLPSSENRQKKDKSFYEYIQDKSCLAVVPEELAGLYYPDEKLLQFVSEDNITIETYNDFLEKRKKQLFTVAMNLLPKM